jgi:microcystin degradation protein MlrC
MLRALVEADPRRAAIGLIADPAAARIAHAAGEGASIEIPLGAKSGIPGDEPFHARFAVERLADGRFTCTGPFYRGARMAIGPAACLRIDGVRIVVASDKPQMADREMYRFVGIEPTEQMILVNKSSVHFRADFAPIAEEILVCKAPGPMLADTSEFPWRNLPAGLRTKPLGPPFGAS